MNDDERRIKFELTGNRATMLPAMAQALRDEGYTVLPPGSADERKPTLLDLLRRPEPLNVEDIPWLVKDFDVLYRTGQTVVDGWHSPTVSLPTVIRALEAQLQRLEPAFRQIEAVKAALRKP
jgi:hypothetical protein